MKMLLKTLMGQFQYCAVLCTFLIAKLFTFTLKDYVNMQISEYTFGTLNILSMKKNY